MLHCGNSDFRFVMSRLENIFDYMSIDAYSYENNNFYLLT